MKKIVLLAWSLVAVATAHAQDKVETTLKGDIVSSYIWRGLDAGSTAIQPTLGVGYKGLSLTDEGVRPDGRLYHWRFQHRYHRLLVQCRS